MQHCMQLLDIFFFVHVNLRCIVNNLRKISKMSALPPSWKNFCWRPWSHYRYVKSPNQRPSGDRAELRRGNGGNCPGAPAARGPPWWNLFVSTKILAWKIFVIQKRYKNTTLPLYSYLALSIRSPQQQLISLQIWLSASFSNRYWIAYKYFHAYAQMSRTRCYLRAKASGCLLLFSGPINQCCHWGQSR